MLENKIREGLEKLEIAEEEIRRAQKVIAKYSTVNREFTARMYDDKELRRAMKARKLWNDKDLGVAMENRYLAEGRCEVTRQKLWANGDKVRVYFDVKVDGMFESTGHYIDLRKE